MYMGMVFPIYSAKARWLKNEFGRLGTETTNPMGKVKA